ncbi:MAG TPA: hypothetical protein VGH63_19925 [Polyangia bacterium]
MAHPVLFGLLGAFVLSRLVLGRRWRHAHGGGGCGRFRGGPIDLGAPDVERGGRFGRRWQRWQRHAEDGRSMVKASPAVDVVGSLELNQRQRELFDDVVAKAKAKLGAGELADALAVVGQEPLERDSLELLVGKGELADDLEHLHFSLTPEQRAKLRAVASA